MRRAGGRLRPPAPERGEELRGRLLGERLGREHPGNPDRRAHLFQVGRAPIADGDVLLEPSAIGPRERALEVARDELHELLAAERLVLGHARAFHCSTSRYSSNALLTFERARWSRSRRLASVMSE